MKRCIWPSRRDVNTSLVHPAVKEVGGPVSGLAQNVNTMLCGYLKEQAALFVLIAVPNQAKRPMHQSLTSHHH